MWARSICLTSASTRLRVSQGGLGSRPAKNMLYSASSCLRSASSRCSSRSRPDGGQTTYRGIRNHTSGSHSSRAYGTGLSSISTSVASERPTISKRSRSRGASSTRTARDTGACGPAAGLAELGRAARQRRAPRRNRGDVESRKNKRDRERARLRAEQRLVQIGIERRRALRSVGCSGSSAYGQNRSSGRYLGGSESSAIVMQDADGRSQG